jgi:hypothetical protein
MLGGCSYDNVKFVMKLNLVENVKHLKFENYQCVIFLFKM